MKKKADKGFFRNDNTDSRAKKSIHDLLEGEGWPYIRMSINMAEAFQRFSRFKGKMGVTPTL